MRSQVICISNVEPVSYFGHQAHITSNIKKKKHFLPDFKCSFIKLRLIDVRT